MARTDAPPRPTTSPHPGGGGERVTAELNSPSAVNLIGRAIRERWELPEQLYRILPLELLRLVTARDKLGNPIEQPRTRVAAARVLAVLHGQNQKADPAPQTHIHAHAHAVTIQTADDRRAAFLARLDCPGDGGRP